MDKPVTAKANHRRTRRRRPQNHSRVTCHKGPFGLGPNVAVSILDVSEGGIRLVVKVPLERGQEVEVILEGMARRPVKVVARVVWCVAAADSHYCIGAHFERSLGYPDLHALACP
jgi:hypothetical protein